MPLFNIKKYGLGKLWKNESKSTENNAFYNSITNHVYLSEYESSPDKIFILLHELGHFVDYHKLGTNQEFLNIYQKEYDKLLETEEYYRNEISKLENEDYIAKLAREKYFKSEEGEIIFKLPEEKE